MPVAPNPLLQASSLSAPSKASSAPADKASQGGAGDFEQVMAGQGRDSAKGSHNDAPAKAGNGKGVPAKAVSVAADGKALPDPAERASSSEQAGKPRDADLVAGQVNDAAPGAQLLQAQAEFVTPLLQAAPLTGADAEGAESQAAFDPQGDALADMPALRLALEQNAKAQGTTSVHADDGEAANDRLAVNPLAIPAEGAETDETAGESGGKSFGALLDDGLKDLKATGSDTRVDDFANRLANLSEAVTAKTASTQPAAMNQPLPMNQGAWTENLVNRVMYLSSQNLKSADIQLAPAELGRLDIRVNVASDHSTQITFISGHAGVRDALDSQMHRLRELFTQQGLQQPDVNVADHSRQQHQPNQQQDAPQLSGVAARRAEGREGAPVGQVGGVQEQQVVLGDSAVDYYA
ncbi:flagellar hook-length control protein FliK [Pseudomonas cremoricolorata]|uniref:Flagellar hook-length control protein n=1 Tax=Pseudomonas cremoricolorata TaxID=157783 RepID=A0A089WSD6_9PSED|nr:flagellar hook-length control protein FliK [Pseudomonas cremoricolorata]AIR90079.1 flagellar hook-length control protein [Pseudomonas cremoricolorata]